MAIKLTVRQQQILDLIRHQLERTGFPPTRAEIARELGFRSANAAEDHLRALARKGAITLTAGASRGIRLLSQNNATNALHHVGPANAPASPEKSGVTLASQGPHQASFGVVTPLARPSNAGSTRRLPAAINRSEHLLLPVVGRVAAGSPILAAEHVDREISVEPSLFTQTPDYLLKVRGLSMRDAGILDGDLLAVKKVTDARHGQIVVARLGDDVTVKRLQRQGKHLTLMPENPDFEPITIAPADDFTLEGIAVGLIRTLQ